MSRALLTTLYLIAMFALRADDKYRVRLQPKLGSMDPADYINASLVDVSSPSDKKKCAYCFNTISVYDIMCRDIGSVCSISWLKVL